MEYTILISLFISLGIYAFKRWIFDIRRKKRRNYYRNEYLKSDAWKRKRFVVLKRDNWQCVYCGAPAKQVHHKRYARKNIGNEPIEWLVSVCNNCHNTLHHQSEYSGAKYATIPEQIRPPILPKSHKNKNGQPNSGIDN